MREIYLSSKAISRQATTSHTEVCERLRNKAKSLSVPLSAPSAIFRTIESAARTIWSYNANFSSGGNFFLASSLMCLLKMTESLHDYIVSCQWSVVNCSSPHAYYPLPVLDILQCCACSINHAT